MKKLILLTVLGLLLLSGCIDLLYGRTRIYTIKYTVTGTYSYADITYTNYRGEEDKVNNARIPWTKTVSITGKWNDYKSIYLNAYGRGNGSLTVAIYNDGSLAKEKKASGYFSSNASIYYTP